MRSSASGGGHIQVTAPTCRAEIRAMARQPLFRCMSDPDATNP